MVLNHNSSSSLPIGISDFSILRQEKRIYVDKTVALDELVREQGFYFLSRPRRFGKSLLISSIESLFRDGVKYFKGLYIEKKWHDRCYPVIHLDFSTCSEFLSIEEFKCDFLRMVKDAVAVAGIDFPPKDQEDPDSTPARFKRIFYRKDLPHIVLLIDEYDAPLNSCLHDRHLFELVKNELNKFYAVIKQCSSKFRLVFIAGICRYKNLGIFSGVNFMTDISLSPEFGTLLGYTREELQKYFASYIEHAACVLGRSRAQCLDEMASHYDGYCFDRQASTHVFSPWSVLNFLKDPKAGFRNYWYDSAGRPSMLLNYIKSHNLKDPVFYGSDQRISEYKLDSSQGLEDIDDVSLLVSTGYLTIKSSDQGSKVFTVNYPNAEVAYSLSALYLEELFGKNADTKIETSALTLFSTYSPDEIIKRLNTTFASIDYARYPVKDEAVLRSFVRIYLIGGRHTRYRY